jgi:hypothetical protein
MKAFRTKGRYVQPMTNARHWRDVMSEIRRELTEIGMSYRSLFAR